MSPVQAKNLFNVNGIVAVITGGGTGEHLQRKISLYSLVSHTHIFQVSVS
jgi:hypothetical protein